MKPMQVSKLQFVPSVCRTERNWAPFPKRLGRGIVVEMTSLVWHFAKLRGLRHLLQLGPRETDRSCPPSCSLTRAELQAVEQTSAPKLSATCPALCVKKGWRIRRDCLPRETRDSREFWRRLNILTGRANCCYRFAVRSVKLQNWRVVLVCVLSQCDIFSERAIRRLNQPQRSELLWTSVRRWLREECVE